MKRETIAVLGAGRLGLVCAAGYARLGHTVICADQRPGRIEAVRSAKACPDEPGLLELLAAMQRTGRLSFTEDIEASARCAGILDVCLEIPVGADGLCDLSEYLGLLRMVGRQIRRYTMILVRSRVPVGTVELSHAMVYRALVNPLVLFDVVSHPTFLRPHRALADWFQPECLIVGHEAAYVRRRIRTLYRGIKAPFVLTDPNSADMIRHAAHACQAAQTAVLDEVAALCDRLDVNAAKVLETIRTGCAPPVWNGSHPDLAGDAATLATCARQARICTPTLDAVDAHLARDDGSLSNLLHRARRGPAHTEQTVCVLGLDRPQDPLRPDIQRRLLELAAAGFFVRVHVPDPAAFARNLGLRVAKEPNPFRAADGACALVVLGAAPRFETSEWISMANLMQEPLLYDPDRLLADRDMGALGFSPADCRPRGGTPLVCTG